MMTIRMKGLCVLFLTTCVLMACGSDHTGYPKAAPGRGGSPTSPDDSKGSPANGGDPTPQKPPTRDQVSKPAQGSIFAHGWRLKSPVGPDYSILYFTSTNLMAVHYCAPYGLSAWVSVPAQVTEETVTIPMSGQKEVRVEDFTCAVNTDHYAFGVARYSIDQAGRLHLLTNTYEPAY